MGKSLIHVNQLKLSNIPVKIKVLGALKHIKIHTIQVSQIQLSLFQ